MKKKNLIFHKDDDSDRNFIEASSNGTVAFNDVTISNANASNSLGLVVAKNSGKLALNGLSFSNCSDDQVFVGSLGSLLFCLSINISYMSI